MPNSWLASLMAYKYPFDLRRFEEARRYPAWFMLYSSAGDRASTIELETHFRNHASESIEPWLEVAFWKMYSQPTTRGNKIVRRMIYHFEGNAITSRSLWDACNRYIENPTREHFESIRTLLGLASPSVALAATFPAFLQPDLFPMVDTRVAKWVDHCLAAHNAADPAGPQLIRPHFADSKQSVLTMRDFSFVKNWVLWCRHTAGKLTACTSIEWRARDVEMAVFNAWGGRHDQHPKIDLEPLTPKRHGAN